MRFNDLNKTIFFGKIVIGGINEKIIGFEYITDFGEVRSFELEYRTTKDAEADYLIICESLQKELN